MLPNDGELQNTPVVSYRALHSFTPETHLMRKESHLVREGLRAVVARGVCVATPLLLVVCPIRAGGRT